MRKMAFITAVLSFSLLSLLGFRTGSVALGSAAAVIGALWCMLLFVDTDRKQLSVLLGLTTTIAILEVLYGASIYLVGLVIVLSNTAWEFAFTEAAIASFSAEMTRNFALRHAINMLGLASTGFALLVIPLQVHISLGFGTALGLGLGLFLLFSALLTLMKTRSRRKTEESPFVKEDGVALLRNAMKKGTGDRSDRPS
ncbi:hypothetical protein J7K60_03345 [Candidatus Bipolaricaulota bacterium]|nr:hypothetical protein [Candidatus Bipolaricaulota bacterium]